MIAVDELAERVVVTGAQARHQLEVVADRGVVLRHPGIMGRTTG